MRNTTHLWDVLEQRLQQYLPAGSEMTPAELGDVELGLSCLSFLLPGTPALTFCHLLRGYHFAHPCLLALDQRQQEMLATCRTILLPYKKERQWKDLLERYRQIEDRLRLFDIDQSLNTFTRRQITVCSEREDLYQEVLSSPLLYQERELHWARAGKTYLCFDHVRRASVTIPEDLPLPLPPRGHVLNSRQTHPPISIPWSALLETAQWMDQQEDQSKEEDQQWERRLRRVQLEIAHTTHSDFTQADQLHFEGLQNYVGMVSAGKSTLMDVTAVWAARNRYRITLVVGDVIALFERVHLFARLGLRAAPISGMTNREMHTNRLYRVLATRQTVHPLSLQHAAFRYTSSACLLDGLRHAATPFLMTPRPCLTLHLPSRRKKTLGEPEKKVYACPFYTACPYHQAQKDLVDASIWIATPASLIYSRLAPQVNSENLTFLELVCMLSDIVIVDEADRVQMQLDQMFSPSQTLMSKKKDAWLGYLLTHVNEQLSTNGCQQVREEPVRKWASILNVASTSLQSIYCLLQSEQSLYSWIKGEQDYFNELTLLGKMAIELAGIEPSPGDKPFEHPEVKRILDAFNVFLDDPLSEKRRHELGFLVLEAIASTRAPVRYHFQQWLKTLVPRLDGEELVIYALRLQFTLMLGVLSHCLEELINGWKQVEAILGLEGSNSMLFHRPPKDYASILPDTPMGNILGYQYLPSSENKKDAGELRFFRCAGVGRALLLNLHHLFQTQGFVGPHVLLLSGTSWAGISPSYHIQAPVTGILRAPDKEVDAITQSPFTFRHLYNSQRRDPLWLSGKRVGQDALSALKEMLDALSQKDRFSASLLEEERESLPEGRQRILLLVGSYQEARQAYAYLAKQREDWEDQMMYLVPDDDAFESEWQSARLQRGIVDRFSSTPAWLLIAPLLAVERGHNILNDEGKAALGAVYFLKRPHPRPNDISYHIHCINRWAIEHSTDWQWITSICSTSSPSIELASKSFRREAYKEWRRLLHMPLIYRTMEDDDQDALTWSQLVSIWQVIGRLVRGGSPAHVVFCDAKFAQVTTDAEDKSHLASGLLFEMREVLAPYFDTASSSTISEREKALVKILYEPLYRALESLIIC